MPASATTPNSFGATRRASKVTTANDRMLLVQVLTADQMMPFFAPDMACVARQASSVAEAGMGVMPARFEAEPPQQIADMGDGNERLVDTEGRRWSPPSR